MRGVVACVWNPRHDTILWGRGGDARQVFEREKVKLPNVNGPHLGFVSLQDLHRGTGGRERDTSGAKERERESEGER